VAQMAAQTPRGQAQIDGLSAQTELCCRRPAARGTRRHGGRGAGGLFKGIAFGARDAEPQHLAIPDVALKSVMATPTFCARVAIFGKPRTGTLDSWHYHQTKHQSLERLPALCRDDRLVLDHLATPLGVGRFEGKRE